MNNKLISSLLAITLILITGPVSAGPEGKSYIGVQYGIGHYSEKDISKDFKPAALIGRFGYYLHPRYSVEVRAGYGTEDDTQFLKEFGLNGLRARLELESILGVYGKGHIDLTASSSLYGVLGFSLVEATASVPAFCAASCTEQKSSISYGIGADLVLSKSLNLNIEYMRYIEKTEYDLDVIGAGVLLKF